MKKIINQIFLLGMMAISSVSWATGGDHVEGGGDYLKTKFRDARVNAIWALTHVTSEILEQFHVDEAIRALFEEVGKPIADDLEGSPYQFFMTDEDPKRESFLINGVEKTFKTEHEPFALIKINIPRCLELQIDRRGASTLFIREGARHLNIQDESKLDRIEEMGLIVMSVYDSIIGHKEDNSKKEEAPINDAQSQAREFALSMVNAVLKQHNKPVTIEDLFELKKFISRDGECHFLLPSFPTVDDLYNKMTQSKPVQRIINEIQGNPSDSGHMSAAKLRILQSEIQWTFYYNLTLRLEKNGRNLKEEGFVLEDDWRNWKGLTLEVATSPGRLIAFIFTWDTQMLKDPWFYKIYEKFNIEKLNSLTIEEVFGENNNSN